MKRYYSFDIFDTCLVRTCGAPTKVFDILAERILGGDSSIQSLRNDFAMERVQGEQRARKALIKDGKEDVSFQEIYEHCDFSFATDILKENIAQVELEIERDVLVPVYSVKNYIERLRSEGKKILFISDMYLPHDFIKNVLSDAGIYASNDILYVSNDVMKGKYTGNLFRHIHDAENISYKEWCHTGDNKYADVYIPNTLGIKAKLTEHKYSRYESIMHSRDYGCSRLDVQVFASIAKAMRLEAEDSYYVNFASNFIAPIFVPFVYSILIEARKRGIETLYFIARDGWILYNIAKQFEEDFPEIGIKYLYASRKSLYLPGVEKVDIDAVETMMGPPFKDNLCDLKDVVDALQVDDFDISSFEDKELDIKTQTERLLNDRNFAEVVEEKRVVQRAAALKYFIQEGLTTGKNAIVDLTGSRLCHKMLNNILESGGYTPVSAFYFEVDTHRIKGNDYWALFYRNKFQDNPQNCMIEPHFMFENYFAITDQRRTAGYIIDNGVSKPFFEDEPGNVEYKKKVMDVNIDVCCKFTRYYQQTLKGADHVNLCNNAVALYSYFFRVPQPEYFKAIEGLYITLSGIKGYTILKKQSFVKTLLDKENLWYNANYVYNSPFPKLTLWCLEKEYSYLYPNEFERPLLYNMVRALFRGAKRIVGK